MKTQTKTLKIITTHSNGRKSEVLHYTADDIGAWVFMLEGYFNGQHRVPLQSVARRVRACAERF